MKLNLCFISRLQHPVELPPSLNTKPKWKDHQPRRSKMELQPVRTHTDKFCGKSARSEHFLLFLLLTIDIKTNIINLTVPFNPAIFICHSRWNLDQHWLCVLETVFSLPNAAKATTLFSKHTKSIVWGMQTRAVQGMMDFDYVCSREEPSVAAMVYPFT